MLFKLYSLTSIKERLNLKHQAVLTAAVLDRQRVSSASKALVLLFFFNARENWETQLELRYYLLPHISYTDLAEPEIISQILITDNICLDCIK